MKQTASLKLLLIAALISGYTTSKAQEICGGDNACDYYYLVIDKKSSYCQNRYDLTADVIDNGYVSISVEGADFIFNGQTYLAGQWVDISTNATETKYCSEDKQYRNYFVWQGAVNVTNATQSFTIKLRARYNSSGEEECKLFEFNGARCLSVNSLCIYRNRSGILEGYVDSKIARQGGYDYQWQKFNKANRVWQTVSSGSSGSVSLELPIPAEWAYKTERYRLRIKPESTSTWYASSSAKARYIPQDCPVVP